MSSLDNNELGANPIATDAVALLNYYFELGNASADVLFEEWLDRYPASWIRLAIIESLYQGRYKAISVSQILEVWQRRHQVFQHFNYDFECLVCNNLPGNASEASAADSPADTAPTEMSPTGDKETPPPTIGQFTPDADRSEFYARLSAIAQQARAKREREAAKNSEVPNPTPSEDAEPSPEGTMTGDRSTHHPLPRTNIQPQTPDNC
ncbi:MAG TPA: hypothetical protein IGS31_11865 [Oscillatoriales cyanobacterium M4454_W2019_049]|nr:MAG: hypothetical protein D6728_10475 [Cyanobacteria bacterium J055]HIK32021.1 hypothetical protein [Oscillatoriales cyanobacterium M4454_W2019_049]